MLSDSFTSQPKAVLNNTLVKEIDGAGPVGLDKVIASAQVDLDATLAGSFPGTGQAWLNVITGADTSADHFLGDDGSANTSDPTWVGPTGPAARFDHDGGDRFTQQAFTDISCMEQAHKTSGVTAGPHWFCMCLQLASTAAANVYFGNSDGIANGIRLLSNPGGNLRFLQGNGSAAYNQEIAASGTISATTDTCIIITLDSSSAGGELYWVNSKTGTSWTNAYSPGATSGAPASAWRIGSGQSGLFLPAGSRSYQFACGNELLDNAKATAIIDELNARHGRTYA